MTVFDTPATRELQAAVAEVVQRVIAPISAATPPGTRLTAEQMRTCLRALQPLGYLGSTIPRDFGGAGLSYVEYGMLLEQVAKGPVLFGEVVPPRTINYLGTAEQKRRWLPKLFSGDWIATAAITEPQAGSDMRAFTTTAVLDGDHYVVNGRKRWLKLGSVADLMTLMVVDPASGGLSRLVVERDISPWVSRDIDTVGLRQLSLAEVTFDGTRVPRDSILGEAGAGGEQFHRGIEASRGFIGIQAVGIASHALDRALAYARERVAFGRPIGKFQAIQIVLADAATRLQAARLLCFNALAILDSGKRAPRDVSMAKVFAVDTALAVCQAAMESMGAWGTAEEAEVERCWRDAAMLSAIDGTAGIQRLIIGRETLGMSAFL
ncbi:alkylation response protein AidB-like acyl-CoA dehydrogenase [Humitalea rosea]|uniref:Alkylation response protein AidB-like acyl-CoA dehydrogenase n=1 Tax=Humitalea rosea TaxID=990373 RepID=A0A2W7IGJ3_9PROT|nr:acyl-CoA dehydrogenase family protein [Humitalea rosea]PZW44772.1 alkylation response protein AidB-like acyl-CoA dehydrogenase [Humitalea rosea]